MIDSGFGFYFQAAGLAATQGAIAPAEQYFEGSRAEVSVVRETGQNSLDAVDEDGDGTVHMQFELQEMPTEIIPGIRGLREHLEQVEEATRGTQGHNRMQKALELAHTETVWVLRISDFGTKGLAGGESKNTPGSPLSALTRGAGISASDGSRGGSFGIGSAVGPMASDLCTVFYTSLPLGQPDVVFAGYSRLASHMDADGTWRVGDGFFTDRSETSDFHYQRRPTEFGPFGPRTQPGTDIFIVGYRKAADDPRLHNIRDAFIENFMMAIHQGKLVVTGKGHGEQWRLDAQTLKTHAATRPEFLAFYRAILDPEPKETTLARFGKVSLHINVDPGLQKTLHTITMRRPLMKIDTFVHTSIPAKYAAVLVCADQQGNTLLRELEPPQHHCWDGGRAADGPAAIRALKKFVRDELRERVRDRVGEIVDIKGLARFLPSDQFTVSEEVGAGRPGIGDDGRDETSTVQGNPGSNPQTRAQGRKKVSVRVQTPARSTGDPDDEKATKGKNAGGSRTRGSSTGDLPGNGEPGKGRSRISAGQVRFRSWSTPSPGQDTTTLQIALTAQENLTGDVELIALGAGGAPEGDYTLPIRSAHVVVDGTRASIAWKDNVLKDVKLADGATTRLEIELQAGRRYRLDVK